MHSGSYYDTLNITPKASDEEVKAAYRTLAKKHHPDFNRDNPRLAELKLKALNEAYAELKTREKRIAYNRALRLSARNDNEKSRRHSLLAQIGEFFWPASGKSAGIQG